MAVLALILTVGWIVIVAGLRGMIQVRRTGGIGLYRGDRPGSPQWWSRRISSVGAALAVGAPLAELGGLAPIPPSTRRPSESPASGLPLGVAGTVIAQMAMGESWRGDVDPDARTPPAHPGPSRLVRNPILTATALTLTGLAVMVPNVIALAMLVLSVGAMQIQVRLVEEPYLRRVHGDAYVAYATRTGRFLPGIGRLGPRSGVPLPE